MNRERERKPIDAFLTTLTERKLPIEQSDARAFFAKTKTHNPPSGFYARLANALDYWDQETFLKEIQAAALLAKSILPPDYTVLVRDKKGSAQWIYKLLLAHGLHPAHAAFAQSYGKLDKSIPKGSCVFTPDDWAIQGAQMLDMLLVAHPEDYDVHQLVLRSTRKAEAFVYQYGKPTSFQTIGYIKNTPEALPIEDRQFLRLLDEIYNPTTRANELFSANSTSHSLAFAWYKVPDNFPTMLTGYPTMGLPPLIRPERFLPPYRRA